MSNEPEEQPDDDGEDVRKVLSGLRKAAPPPTFTDDVTDTIHKRSAGRFFGKRTFGDRVPFNALLIVAVIALIAIAYVMWSSTFGSLRVEHPKAPPAAGSDLVPKP
ncbi:MAG TPA: hypothetical protein VGM88_19815 [Kofleriaceae bacterium]|jgi:ABC-type uncharacterized transport system permease subunit